MNYNHTFRIFTNWIVMGMCVLNVVDVVIGTELTKNGSFVLVIHALLVMNLAGVNSVLLDLYLTLAMLFASVIGPPRTRMIIHGFWISTEMNIILHDL